jgi:histidinol dehydrogenase
MPKFLKSSEQNFKSNLLAAISYESEQNFEVIKTVAEIISNIRKSGDSALFEYTRKFDNFEISDTNLKDANLKITTEEIDEAYSKCDPKIIEAFRTAYTRVKDYHERQLPLDERYEDEIGVKLGWRWTPVDSVGLYVPGGKAFYPSSVIMNAVPALVAGVRRIAMVSPAINGNINPMVLVAARICGVHEIYKIGGAQAVAALAYGTNSVAPVCKIVGPGNAYVAEAKRQVFGKVGIDMIAGPSEILVISDAKTNPKWIAADLLSQAEHDADARSILITDSEDFANKVINEVDVTLEKLDRFEIASKSWSNNGVVIIVENLETQAADIANIIASEHVEICTDKPNNIAKNIHNAGALFMGRFTPEAIGDYIAGPSHVLPTAQSAKFSSGLGVMEFMKRTSIISCSESAFQELQEQTAIMAKSEGLGAHALSITVRK